MEKDETEVKFHVADFREAAKELRKIQSYDEAITCVKTEGKEGFLREENFLFDDQQCSLRKKGEILRLRKWGDKYTLTFKGPKRKSEVKKRPEFEVEVNRIEEAEKILEKLGYLQYMKYEKERKKFDFEVNGTELEVCFDKMPYGNFVEVEGAERDLKMMAEKLGFEWRKRITEDYIKIFEDLRKEKELGFSHLTFDNFAEVNGRDLDFEIFIQAYYACNCTEFC